VIDSTLGRLCRWLRLAGFDSVIQEGIPDARRLAADCTETSIVLTRSMSVLKELPLWQVLFIPYNNPLDQIRYVLSELELAPDPGRLLTRCVICNLTLVPAEKYRIQNKVPDHVFQTKRHFFSCPQCRRVYWRGTHARRFERLLESWQVSVGQ